LQLKKTIFYALLFVLFVEPYVELNLKKNIYRLKKKIKKFEKKIEKFENLKKKKN